MHQQLEQTRDWHFRKPLKIYIAYHTCFKSELGRRLGKQGPGKLNKFETIRGTFARTVSNVVNKLIIPSVRGTFARTLPKNINNVIIGSVRAKYIYIYIYRGTFARTVSNIVNKLIIGSVRGTFARSLPKK